MYCRFISKAVKFGNALKLKESSFMQYLCIRNKNMKTFLLRRTFRVQEENFVVFLIGFLSLEIL